jgi:hypothetical protein
MAQNHNPNLYFEPDVEGEAIRRKFLAFLNEFTTVERENTRPFLVYKDEAEKMMKNKRTTIYVDFRHLIEWSQDFGFAETVHGEYYK